MRLDEGSVSISIRLDTIQEKTIAQDRFVIIVSFWYIRTILLEPQDYPVEAIEGDLQTGAHVLEGLPRQVLLFRLNILEPLVLSKQGRFQLRSDGAEVK